MINNKWKKENVKIHSLVILSYSVIIATILYVLTARKESLDAFLLIMILVTLPYMSVWFATTYDLYIKTPFSVAFSENDFSINRKLLNKIKKDNFKYSEISHIQQDNLNDIYIFLNDVSKTKGFYSIENAISLSNIDDNILNKIKEKIDE